MIMVPKCHVQILALFLAVWPWGTCLTSLGFVFLNWEIASTIALISQGCTDQTSYVCNWIMPGAGKDQDGRSVFYHYCDGRGKQIGVLWVLSCSISTSICDMIPTTCDTMLYMGKEQQIKMPPKPPHLSNALWCGGEVGEDVKSIEVRMAVPVPGANMTV